MTIPCTVCHRDPERVNSEELLLHVPEEAVSEHEDEKEAP